MYDKKKHLSSTKLINTMTIASHLQDSNIHFRPALSSRTDRFCLHICKDQKNQGESFSLYTKINPRHAYNTEKRIRTIEY